MPDIFKRIQSSKFNGAFLTTKDIVDFLNVQYYPRMSFIMAEEDIMNFNVCFYYPKTSCIPQQFNKWISRLLTNGLIQTWIKDSNDIHVQGKIGKGPQKLRFGHLEGGFQLLIYGLTFSFFTFIVEVFSKKSLFLSNKLFS